MTFRLAIIVGLSAMLFVSAAPAQQKLELFGGYQYARPDGGPNLNGWNAALTGNFTRNFGITGDFGGTYGGGGSMYTFALGPKVSGTTSGVRPFAHVLFGGVRLGPSGFTTTAFVTMLGGGLNVGRRNIEWGAMQADWLIIRAAGFADRKNVRVSTGLVLRF